MARHTGFQFQTLIPFQSTPSPELKHKTYSLSHYIIHTYPENVIIPVPGRGRSRIIPGHRINISRASFPAFGARRAPKTTDFNRPSRSIPSRTERGLQSRGKIVLSQPAAAVPRGLSTEFSRRDATVPRLKRTGIGRTESPEYPMTAKNSRSTSPASYDRFLQRLFSPTCVQAF